MMAQLSGMDQRRRARMFGYMTSGEDAVEVAAPIMAGLVAGAWGFPVMLGVRIVLAGATEIYTVAVTHRYLPAQEKTKIRVRLAIPLRVAAGIVLGFGAGWLVGDAQRDSAPASPAETREGQPAAGDCGDDPTLAEIRRRTGAC
jgi:hypothetical protein